MANTSSFLIPSETIVVEQEISKSRFIATVGHVQNKGSAKKFITNVEVKHNGATHNAYGFIAGNPSGTADIGCSDDGEIPGTAGKPILSILQHKSIGEIAAVVTRYFGGIKLGTGGLVRAYSGTLILALDKIHLIERFDVVRMKIIIDYKHENPVRRAIERMGISIKNATYANKASIAIEVPDNIIDELVNSVMNVSQGRARMLSTDYADGKIKRRK